MPSDPTAAPPAASPAARTGAAPRPLVGLPVPDLFGEQVLWDAGVSDGPHGPVRHVLPSCADASDVEAVDLADVARQPVWHRCPDSDRDGITSAAERADVRSWLAEAAHVTRLGEQSCWLAEQGTRRIADARAAALALSDEASSALLTARMTAPAGPGGRGNLSDVADYARQLLDTATDALNRTVERSVGPATGSHVAVISAPGGSQRRCVDGSCPHIQVAYDLTVERAAVRHVDADHSPCVAGVGWTSAPALPSGTGPTELLRVLLTMSGRRGQLDRDSVDAAVACLTPRADP